MTTEPDPRPAELLCCGKQRTGKWLPRKDEPQVHACQLCIDSGRYWRDEAEMQQGGGPGLETRCLSGFG